ncbi:DUF835 domain-containing protein [Thermococcus sp. 21S9]|uniref:DUF835 domain-containing protein n=1 Tax=Thermococcus sp. 21S9 TaxID=1638223 RepID=UPI0014388D92|nr:DUF835 domain-containing protein [Thermococcus sp. 21S9]NJE54365.1 DUF835 domain-containing protein [Thermococcus sp. 21S9]
MGLIVPVYILVIDILLAVAIGYAFLFMLRRLNRYDPELNAMVKYSVIFLGIAEIGRIVDIIDDFCCRPSARYFEIVAYLISILGVIYTVVYYIKLVENRYIPTPPKADRKSSLGAHIVFSKNRLLDVIELLKNADFPVLAVTRSPGMYEGFDNVSTVWVTQVSGGVNPTALHVLHDVILRFVQENPGSAVLIDCVEYLLLYNDFRTVFKFLTNLKDHVVLQHGSGLVIFVDDSVLSEQEKALLLKEFEPL